MQQNESTDDFLKKVNERLVNKEFYADPTTVNTLKQLFNLSSLTPFQAGLLVAGIKKLLDTFNIR